MRVFVLYFMGPDTDGQTFGKFLGVYLPTRGPRERLNTFNQTLAIATTRKGFRSSTSNSTSIRGCLIPVRPCLIP